MKKLLPILFSLFLFPFLASASIVITINSPKTTGYYDQTVSVDVSVASTYAVSSVTATVSGRVSVLQYNSGAGKYLGTMDLTGLSQGQLQVDINVIDVLGNTQAKNQLFNFDRKPTITILKPISNHVSRDGKVRIKAIVNDPGNPTCQGRISYGSNVLVFTDSIDTVVDLLPSVNIFTRVVIVFKPIDNNNQSGEQVGMDIQIEKSPYLLDYFSGDGGIFIDVKDDKALMGEGQVATPRLKIFNTNTGALEQVYNSDVEIKGAILCKGGAAFIKHHQTSLADSLYILQNNVATNISRIVQNRVSSLVSNGNYLIWVGESLNVYSTDLTTLTTTKIFTSFFGGGRLSPDGILVYSNPSGNNIYRYTLGSGVTEQITTTGKSSSPDVDGNNIAYTYGSTGAFSVRLNNGLSDVELGQIANTSTTLYKLNDGYVAFTKKDISAVDQIWTRTPNNIFRQNSFFSTRSTIQAIGNKGMLIFENGSSSYFSDSLTSFKKLTSDAGKVYFTNNEFYYALGNNLFRYIIPSATLPPQPVSFSPASAATGSTVTVRGTNFIGITAVSFGGIPAQSFTVSSDSVITAIVGAGTSGAIVLTSPGGSVGLNGFVHLPPPTITSISPTSAATNAFVTITGTNLIGATAVSFGSVAATTFTINSATSITAKVGSGASGNVAVASPSGTATLAGFVYLPPPAITSISPTSAPTGAPVTITGTNFTGATVVSFGGTAATSFTVNSATSITAIVGGGTSGSIVVTTPNGSASLTGFTYLPPPVITSLSASTGTKDSFITITGSNFTGATAVSFGGTAAASFVVNSATSITAKVGVGTNGSVSVTTPNGSTTFAGFLFVPVPVITATGPTNIQNGGTVAFTSTASGSGYTYQWLKDGNTISGANSATYTASQSGSYSLKITLNTVEQTSLPIVVSVTFALPANNFKLTNTAASCKGSTTGAINILAVQNLSYTATITNSSNVSTAYPFNTTLDINNLSAGTYQVCLTVAGQTAYQQCFTSVITEPKDLSLYTSVIRSTNEVVLSLGGADTYHISLNGTATINKSGQVTLPLKNGTNTISVSTDLPCQGVVTREIVVDGSIPLFPNPFVDHVTINLGNEVVKNAIVRVYDTYNRVVFTKDYVNRSGLVQLDLQNLTRGIYILRVGTDQKETMNKIIKN
jgi:hypothetical protein